MVNVFVCVVMKLCLETEELLYQTRKYISETFENGERKCIQKLLSKSMN